MCEKNQDYLRNIQIALNLVQVGFMFIILVQCWVNISSRVLKQPYILHNAEICLYKPWRPIFFFLFVIIINALTSSFRFISILMLWVYDYYIFVIHSVRGSTFDVIF